MNKVNLLPLSLVEHSGEFPPNLSSRLNKLSKKSDRFSFILSITSGALERSSRKLDQDVEGSRTDTARINIKLLCVEFERM